jgi:hypothetical protein
VRGKFPEYEVPKPAETLLDNQIDKTILVKLSKFALTKRNHIKGNIRKAKNMSPKKWYGKHYEANKQLENPKM